MLIKINCYQGRLLTILKKRGVLLIRKFNYAIDDLLKKGIIRISSAKWEHGTHVEINE